MAKLNILWKFNVICVLSHTSVVCLSWGFFAERAFIPVRQLRAFGQDQGWNFPQKELNLLKARNSLTADYVLEFNLDPLELQSKCICPFKHPNLYTHSPVPLSSIIISSTWFPASELCFSHLHCMEQHSKDFSSLQSFYILKEQGEANVVLQH